MNKVFLALSFITFFGSACSKNSGSALKLDNGVRVFKDDADTIPGVVYIGGCTSTAVSDTTLVTAAHCVTGGKQVCIAGSLTSDQGKGACTSNVTVPTNYVDATQNSEPDFAVAIFPTGTFKNFFPVSLTKLERNENVLLVGYSRLVNLNQPNAENEDNKGTKRWGKNHITDTNQGYSTNLDGTFNAAGLSQGDSGGPMFNRKCELVGAASTRGGNSSHHSNSSANSDFFHQMEAKGAYFCGTTGLDSSHCSGALAAPIQDDGSTADGRPVFPCGYNGASGGNGGNSDKSNNKNGLSDSDIKIKMHDTALSDSPMAFFSVAKQVTYIEICATASIEDCNSSNSSYKKVTSGFALGSRKAMYTQMQATKADGSKSFVIIARDNSETLIASRAFNLKGN